MRTGEGRERVKKKGKGREGINWGGRERKGDDAPQLKFLAKPLTTGLMIYVKDMRIYLTY